MLRKQSNRDDTITDSEKESLTKMSQTGEGSTINENMSAGKTSINNRKFKSGSRSISRTPHASLNTETSSKHERYSSSSSREGKSRNRHGNTSANDNSFPESLMEQLMASSTTNKVLITIIGFLLMIVMTQNKSSPTEKEIFYGAPENFEPNYGVKETIHVAGMRDVDEHGYGTKKTINKVGLRDEDILFQYNQKSNRGDKKKSGMELPESRKEKKKRPRYTVI